MNGMNMNNMNMQAMNMNGMSNMNNMNGMNAMPMNNMNNMNAMKMNQAAVGAGYPMAAMGQQQHFTNMPVQHQAGQPQQPQQPQPQQQQQQPQQQFIMQGMTPQFAQQRIPQGMQQPQTQQPQPQQPQQQGQPSQPQGPTQQGQHQYGEMPFNGQSVPQPPSMMMNAQPPKSSGPSSAAPHSATTPLPPGSATSTANPSGTPTASGPAQMVPQRQQMMAGRGAMRAGAGTTGAPGMNMGMNAAANANAVMNYRRHVTNTETLKFLDFCELIGVRSESTKNILYWKKIITEYFSESGVLRYAVKAGVDSRQFEFSVPIIPRFFFSIIQSGVTRIEIQPGMLRTHVLPNGTTYLESPRCCLTHHYADGSYVNIHGSMKSILNQNLKIDWLDFQTHVFIPGVEWPSLEKLLSDETKMRDVLTMLNDSSGSASPLSKNGTDDKGADTRKLNVLQKFRSNFQVFHTMSNFGLQESVMRVMQVSDVMAHLRSLMMFSISSSTTGPLHALDEFVARTQKKDGTPPKKATTSAAGANGNGSAAGGATGAGSTQKSSEPASQKNSPSVESPPVRGANGKVTTLDMSQSTLSKRRRKSTVGELSPKSLADSPKTKQRRTKR